MGAQGVPNVVTGSTMRPVHTHMELPMYDADAGAVIVAGGSGPRAMSTVTGNGAEVAAPLLLLIDADQSRRAGRAAELRRAHARVAELGETGRVGTALNAAVVDAIVVCADDAATCQSLVLEARAQIAASNQAVPLIAWQSAPNGPHGRRAIMLQLGADVVLESPSTTTDVLASAFALRRLIRNVHMAG